MFHAVTKLELLALAGAAVAISLLISAVILCLEVVR